jgi:histidinol-phosphate aminotransferase
MVLIDEAYIDFLNPPDNESMFSLTSSNPNVAVVRTFSKIHGMAGLRIGFLVGHPDLIRSLEANYFQHTQIAISNLSQAAALASLKDEQHRQSCKMKNAEAREFTLHALQDLHIRCIPSFTNFMFFSLGDYKGDFAQDMLSKNGIILRSSVYGDGKWGRVSIGTLDEMRKFAAVMQATWKS